MKKDGDETEEERIARVVKEACIRAAVEGFENAAMDGLCHEGAVEAAVSAISRLDLEALLAELARK